MVACGACTSKKWLLAEQSSKPLRVCLTCYDKLAAKARHSGEFGNYLQLTFWEKSLFHPLHFLNHVLKVEII